jgi:hypothetical protein
MELGYRSCIGRRRRLKKGSSELLLSTGLVFGYPQFEYPPFVHLFEERWNYIRREMFLKVKKVVKKLFLVKSELVFCKIG